jgi:surface protein
MAIPYPIFPLFETADIRLVSSQSCFQTTDELKTAIGEYIADSSASSAVVGKYGAISTWCTSLITDFHGLFEGQREFNADLSDWDTRAVTDMSSELRVTYQSL